MNRGFMDAIDAIKRAATMAGVPITHIGVAMGKRANYVSVAANKNQRLRTDIAAAMLNVCGYSLCAVPNDLVDDTAMLRITATED